MKIKTEINNQIYNELGLRWYTAKDDPVALLRAESKVKAPWVAQRIRQHFPSTAQVLDLGCGAGFLSNELAESGLLVTGLDMSNESLEIAKLYDKTKKVQYIQGDAACLPFADASFDVVTAMDFLEHVENPTQIIQELSRVLKPNGLFFFHTFNRNILSYFLVIKAVEWLVPNTPPHMHLYRMFITPKELAHMCIKADLHPLEWTGIRPQFFSWAFWKSVFSRLVRDDFRFSLTSSLKISYLGYAKKSSAHPTT